MSDYTVTRHERDATTFQLTGKVAMHPVEQITLRARIHPFFAIQAAYIRFLRNPLNVADSASFARVCFIVTLWRELALLPPEEEARGPVHMNATLIGQNLAATQNGPLPVPQHQTHSFVQDRGGSSAIQNRDRLPSAVQGQAPPVAQNGDTPIAQNQDHPDIPKQATLVNQARDTAALQNGKRPAPEEASAATTGSTDNATSVSASTRSASKKAKVAP